MEGPGQAHGNDEEREKVIKEATMVERPGQVLKGNAASRPKSERKTVTDGSGQVMDALGQRIEDVMMIDGPKSVKDIEHVLVEGLGHAMNEGGALRTARDRKSTGPVVSWTENEEMEGATGQGERSQVLEYSKEVETSEQMMKDATLEEGPCRVVGPGHVNETATVVQLPQEIMSGLLMEGAKENTTDNERFLPKTPDMSRQSKSVSAQLKYQRQIYCAKLKDLRSKAYIREYIEKELRERWSNEVLFSGSLTEGSSTDIKGSDLDVMVVFPDTLVLRCDAVSPNHTQTNLFLLDNVGVRSGFAKLYLPQSQCTSVFIQGCLVKDGDDKAYISSEKFIETIVDYADKSLLHCIREYATFARTMPGVVKTFRHGPCVSTDAEREGSKETLNDTAWGLKCTHWPEEAEEWVSRPRPKGWPKEETVARLKDMSCYLMPVGDSTSEECHLEWRYAFVPTERELVWEFSDTQIQCLFLLKRLKKQYLDPLAPDQLSPFLLKTIVFWKTEEHGLDIWTPDNLLPCLHMCLETLKMGVFERQLPHYIFRARNLLFGKFDIHEQQNAVLQKICDIQQEMFYFICQDLRWLRPMLTPEIFSHEISPIISLHQKGIELEEVRNNLVTVILTDQTSKDKVNRFVDFLKRKQEIQETTQNLYACFAQIQLGKHLFVESKNHGNKVIPGAYLAFHKGQHLDKTDGPLHLPTFWYKLGKFNSAMKIINSITSNEDQLLFLHLDTPDAPGKIISSYYFRNSDIHLKTVLAFFVHFTPEDIDFVPEALKFDCALLHESGKPKSLGSNCYQIHPLAYSYYLEFQIGLDQNNDHQCRSAIEKLSNFLKRDNFQGFGYLLNKAIELLYSFLKEQVDVPHYKEDLHREFNLLGFCYYKMENYEKAMECFNKSLLIKLDRNVAAIYRFQLFVRLTVPRMIQASQANTDSGNLQTSTSEPLEEETDPGITIIYSRKELLQ